MSKSLAQLQVEAAAEYWRLGVALPVSWFWAEGTIADGLSPSGVTADAPQPADDTIGAESSA